MPEKGQKNTFFGYHKVCQAIVLLYKSVFLAFLLYKIGGFVKNKYICTQRLAEVTGTFLFSLII